MLGKPDVLIPEGHHVTSNSIDTATPAEFLPHTPAEVPID